MDVFIAKALPWFKLILFTFALVLSACGGGGSGSGPTGISYVGNTDPAVIDRSNAARLVGNILFGQTIAESSSGGAFKIDTSIDASTQGIGLAHFPGHLSQKLRNAMLSSPRVASRGVAIQSRTVVDETEPCSNSDGSLHITGVIYDNGTGTLTSNASTLNNLTLSGAAITLANATHTVAGAVDFTDGNITAGSSTVFLTGTANFDGDYETLNNLTIDGTTNTITMTAINNGN